MSRLDTRILYGIRTDIIGNAHFITDDEVVYIVGNALSIQNFSQNRQRLIRLPEKHKINLMTLAPNKKYVALCEEGEKPLISIYDLNTQKRKKLLGIPGDSSGISSFSCISFTFDSKFLAVVTNERQTMFFYNWEKGKLESSLELEGLQVPNAKINLMSCNPAETAIIALAGVYTFKFLTLTETLWRPYGFSKVENLFITSITWVNSDRLLAGTRDGRILFLENGDLKNIFKVSETDLMNLKIKNENVAVSQGAAQRDDLDDKSEICGLCSFSRGVAFAYGYGTVVLFEKDGPHKFIKKNVYMVPRQTLREDEPEELYRVKTVVSNPSSDKLLITTGWSQLFYALLWTQSAEEQQSFQLLGPRLHHGPIGGLSTCIWKSHFVTFGIQDCTVMMWDYETTGLIMVKQYSEDITCVILHPTGLFCLIGFSDKLRFMNILIDDFMVMKEFSIRNCKKAQFSYGGHLFAAVNGNIIQVYSVTDFSIRYLFKGHTDIITQINWTIDDRKLISIGSEGAIYEWDINTGIRVNEVVLKGITLSGVVLSSDGVTSYCVSTDGKIHEVKENTVIRTYSMPTSSLDKIVMGKDDTLIFVTYPGGFVSCLNYPLTDPIEYTEYHVHYTNITKISLTYDEQVLLTTGDDGTLCFWRIIYPEGKATTLSAELLYLNQVLISRGDLGEKVQTIVDLNTRIKELESEHAYNMRQTINQNNDKVRDLHLSYCEAIEELRSKIDQLEEDHTNEINNINVEIANTKRAHDEAMREMEISYDNKLIVEYDKYSAFEERNNAMREDFEAKIESLIKRSEADMEDLVEKNQMYLEEKDLQLKEAHEELTRQVRVHELIKAQIEDDADREIMELRTNYEALLNEERALVLKFKGEAGVLRNKYAISQKDVENFKWQLTAVKDEYAQLKARKEELEKNLEDSKNELKEKESIIADRDKKIVQLGLANKELETFKFVLDHRIKELMGQIEPRDLEIAELKEKIKNMEDELIALYKTNQSLELQLHELRAKLSATKSELKSEMLKHKNSQKLLRKIRMELLDTSSLIAEPFELRKAVMKLYNKYSDSEQFLRIRMAELDAKCEFMKQRNFLENTIALLKKNRAQQSKKYTGELDRLFEENIILLHEMSDLRDMLNGAQKHVTEMECLLVPKDRDTGATESKAKLTKACHCSEELEQNCKMQMQECQKIISVLKEDIDRLLKTFPETQSKCF